MNTWLTLLMLCLLVLFAEVSHSQPIEKDSLQKYVSSGNSGTEFWITLPPYYKGALGEEKALRIIVSSEIEQEVTIVIPGKKYTVKKQIKAFEATEIVVSALKAQPYEKEWGEKAPPEKIYPKAGVHISSEAPIIVYVWCRYQGAGDGYVAIPASKLGTDYVVSSWPELREESEAKRMSSYTCIVAVHDSTHVQFTLGGNEGTQTTGGLKIGEKSFWTLQRGDVLCFANDGVGQDISGSRVLSDKPIGVISGNQCSNIPKGVFSCNYTVEMEMPTSYWGTEYYVIPIIGRLKNPIVRVFAHPDVKDVKVYRDGVEWKTLQNGNRIENEAFFTERSYDVEKLALISSDAPINVVLYNTSAPDDNQGSNPFQSTLIPLEQFSKKVTFMPPINTDNEQYIGAHYVNAICQPDAANAYPYDLEVEKEKNGKRVWAPIRYQVKSSTTTSFNIKSKNGKQYACFRFQVPVEPGQGNVIKARSTRDFSFSSYGISGSEFYGFPTTSAFNDMAVNDYSDPIIIEKKSKVYEWSGIAEDYVTRKFNGKSENDVWGVITGLSLVKEYSFNMEITTSNVPNFQNNPALWTLRVTDRTQPARGVIIATDNTGNYTYREFTYSPTDDIVSVQGEEVYLDLTRVNTVNATLTIKAETKNSSVVLSDCEIDNTANFLFDCSNINNYTLQPGETLLVAVQCKAEKEGVYKANIKFKVNNDQFVAGMIVLKVVNSVLKVEGNVRFDATLVNTESNTVQDFTLARGEDTFAGPPTIVRIESFPENAIAFDGKSFGTSGFQIDTSLFFKKRIDNKIRVPVKFKALKDGSHSAWLRLYLNDTDPPRNVDFMGIGTLMNSNSEEIGDIKTLISITNAEIIIKGSISDKEKRYSVVNNMGEVLIKGTFTNTDTHISLQGLVSGMYILSLEENGNVKNTKFVVLK